MSTIEKVWKQFLTNILRNTFLEFISQEEINERVNWIVLNLFKINPDSLYKSVLYCMNNNIISKIAIEFKLKFITDDYKTLFQSPSSIEIDGNNYISQKDKLILNAIVNARCLSINHHIELVLLQGKDLINDQFAIDEISEYLKIPNYNHLPPTFVKDGHIVHYLTFSQLLYTVAFNQNPFTGMPCSNEIKDYVNKTYPERLKIMQLLKNSWPNGIELKYVRSNNIFG